LLSSGGNYASSTGYVVYRCMQMDACTISDTVYNGQDESYASFAWNNSSLNNPNPTPMTGNYIIIDGFAMTAAPGAGSTGYGQGVSLWDGPVEFTKTAPPSVHHIWILNSVITGFGQAGVNMNDGEYFFVVHNRIYRNAHTGCKAQGSGLAYVVLKAFPKYVRTEDDSRNPILGEIASFNNAMEWNVVYDNATTRCGDARHPYDTDGNNIILDTLDNAGYTNKVYPGSVLVAFNIAYNAGGRGIHIFRSENITVANNSCYNNDLDPYENAAYRPCIGDNIGYHNLFFNNIAYAIPNPNLGVPNCGGSGVGCLGFNGAFSGGLKKGKTFDIFVNNISYCLYPNGYTQPWGWGCDPMFNGDYFPTKGPDQNFPQTNPLWKNVGNLSQGTETKAPRGVNFALLPGSPAIGKGLATSYMSSQSFDIGACPHTAATCP
jgi:parallel beta-helix repeat protein